MTYDASRCADAGALEGLRAWDMIVGSDIRYLFALGRPSPSVVHDALAEEAKLPLSNQPWWICRSGIIAMQAAISGSPGPLRLRPEKEWPELRKSAQEGLKKLAGVQ